MCKRLPLSLYVHIPFCTLKCSYCDFNSYAGIEGLMGPFVEALCEEMRLWGGALAQGWGPEPHEKTAVETVFFGGGTPSLLPASMTSSGSWRQCGRDVPTSRARERARGERFNSFEANPGTVDRDTFAACAPPA